MSESDAMTEKPIIFSAPMVRAILAGRKTMTRRLLRWPAWCGFEEPAQAKPDGSGLYCGDSKGSFLGFLSPRYEAGWHLWVKETHGFLTGNGIRVVYRADADPPLRSDGSPVEGMRWKPSIFTKREHSRLTLEVTAVRVERLQDITEADARDEGVDELDGEIDEVALCAMAKRMGSCATDGKVWFAVLWDAINADRAAWDSNPWVAVVSFKRLDGADPAHL